MKNIISILVIGTLVNVPILMCHAASTDPEVISVVGDEPELFLSYDYVVAKQGEPIVFEFKTSSYTYSFTSPVGSPPVYSFDDSTQVSFVPGLPNGMIWEREDSIASETDHTRHGLIEGFTYRLDLISLTGAPTEVGTYIIEVVAVNTLGESRRSFQIIVTSAAPLIKSIPSEISVREGDTLSFALDIDNIPAEDYSVEIEGDLPAGITLEETSVGSFKLSGEPTGEEGRYPIEIIATNRYGEDRIAVDLVIRATSIFDSNSVSVSGGIIYSDWMGFLFEDTYPWVYSYELGWFYVHESSEDANSVWLYHAGEDGLGWMFGGRNKNGFFYFEVEDDVWDWEWIYTGVIDFTPPETGPDQNTPSE